MHGSSYKQLHTAISHNYDEQQLIRMELQLAPFYAKVPVCYMMSISPTMSVYREWCLLHDVNIPNYECLQRMMFVTWCQYSQLWVFTENDVCYMMSIFPTMSVYREWCLLHDVNIPNYECLQRMMFVTWCQYSQLWVFTENDVCCMMSIFPTMSVYRAWCLLHDVNIPNYECLQRMMFVTWCQYSQLWVFTENDVCYMMSIFPTMSVYREWCLLHDVNIPNYECLQRMMFVTWCQYSQLWVFTEEWCLLHDVNIPNYECLQGMMFVTWCQYSQLWVFTENDVCYRMSIFPTMSVYRVWCLLHDVNIPNYECLQRMMFVTWCQYSQLWVFTENDVCYMMSIFPTMIVYREWYLLHDVNIPNYECLQRMMFVTWCQYSQLWVFTGNDVCYMMSIFPTMIVYREWYLLHDVNIPNYEPTMGKATSFSDEVTWCSLLQRYSAKMA